MNKGNKNIELNYVLQAYLSIMWCEACMRPENSNLKIGELLKTFTNQNENIKPFNIGTLYMAANSIFAYLQGHFEDDTTVDYKEIDTEKFSLIEGSPAPTEKRNFLNRIRNSIAHGRFEISNNGLFTFSDQGKNGTNEFKASINYQDLGKLINDHFYYFKNTILNINKTTTP